MSWKDTAVICGCVLSGLAVAVLLIVEHVTNHGIPLP